jgi:hypothetical protein
MYHLSIYYSNNNYNVCLVNFDCESIQDCIVLLRCFAFMLSGGYKFLKATVEFEKLEKDL